MISSERAELFWSIPCPEPNTGCWLWTRYCDPDGYARFRGEGTHRANRVAWELAHGPIPDGLVVCHRCDTPACVNPAHLFLGTNADNMADRDAKGRAATGPRNGMHTKPESRRRGDQHHTHRDPAQAMALARRVREAPELLRRGETHPCAKLTADDVRVIRARAASGRINIAATAREFGVSNPVIVAVIRRETWKHVA